MFGKSKLDLLRQYLPHEHGVPSDDSVRRFFRAIDTSQFQRLFVEWIRVWLSPEAAGKVGQLMVKRYVAAVMAGNRRYTWYQPLPAKRGDRLESNEITAIPELLAWLDVRGAIVTLDAMGCQKALAEKIIDKGGDYLLALKGNQSNLHDDVTSTV